MLFKLLKYDLRAMWKQFSLVWGAALVLALANRLTHSLHFIIVGSSNVANLVDLALTIVFVAMFVISILFVIQHFSKGLLGSEGYLMHTLPVRAWQLVLSKLICAIVTGVGSCVAAFLSVVIMLPADYREFFQLPLWGDIFRGLMKHPDMLALTAEFCLVVLSFIVQTIAVIYLSLSIGHLVPRHRKLAGVAAFIGLYVLMLNVYDRVFSARLIRQLMDVTASNVHGSMLTAIAALLIPAAVFLAAVCWILEHKLNLE